MILLTRIFCLANQVESLPPKVPEKRQCKQISCKTKEPGRVEYASLTTTATERSRGALSESVLGYCVVRMSRVH